MMMMMIIIIKWCIMHVLKVKSVLCQEWQVLEGTILQLVSELFMKLKAQKTDTGKCV